MMLQCEKLVFEHTACHSMSSSTWNRWMYFLAVFSP